MATSTATKITRPRNFLLAWIFSSIGKKTIVAITGFLLLLFVAGHLAGNLTFFVSDELINEYAVKLKALGPILWLIRLGLLAVFAAHIAFTILLWKENSAARPEKYAIKKPIRSTIFSRTMRLSGLVVFAFVIFHILHFTIHLIDPSYSDWHDEQGRLDVFRMLVVGFSVPWISAFYILALGLLAFHLSHGIGSLFQTLGLSNRRLQPIFTIGGRVIAWALFAGFASIPVSVLLGYGQHVLR